MDAQDDVVVRGVACLAFGQACVNLNFFIDDEMRTTLSRLEPDTWYPLSLYLDLMRVVSTHYVDPAPILERIGSEIVRLWNLSVGGHYAMKRPVDFLYLQTGSEGYYSVIKGPPEKVGEFVLASVDEEAGRAVVHSTTPFPKDLERGILLGGLGLFESLDYIDVDNAQHPNLFLIEFH